jgi:hypothetical protein
MIPVFRGNGERHLRRKSIPHPDYLFRTPTHWRMRAEKMRALAEEANDSTVRAMMLRIASDYDRLAESADDHGTHDSIMFRRADVKPESLPETPSKPTPDPPDHPGPHGRAPLDFDGDLRRTSSAQAKHAPMSTFSHRPDDHEAPRPSLRHSH